jgi:hypothetical protein
MMGLSALTSAVQTPPSVTTVAAQTLPSGMS